MDGFYFDVETNRYFPRSAPHPKRAKQVGSVVKEQEAESLARCATNIQGYAVDVSYRREYGRMTRGVLDRFLFCEDDGYMHVSLCEGRARDFLIGSSRRHPSIFGCKALQRQVGLGTQNNALFCPFVSSVLSGMRFSGSHGLILSEDTAYVVSIEKDEERTPRELNLVQEYTFNRRHLKFPCIVDAERLRIAFAYDNHIIFSNEGAESPSFYARSPIKNNITAMCLWGKRPLLLSGHTHGHVLVNQLKQENSLSLRKYTLDSSKDACRWMQASRDHATFVSLSNHGHLDIFDMRCKERVTANYPIVLCRDTISYSVCADDFLTNIYYAKSGTNQFLVRDMRALTEPLVEVSLADDQKVAHLMWSPKRESIVVVLESHEPS